MSEQMIPQIYQAMVLGPPASMGSKRIGRNRKTGDAMLLDDNRPKLRSWQSRLREALMETAPPHPINGPVAVVLDVYLLRPRAHYRTGRYAHILRDDAPTWAAVEPDADKVLRAALDCLTGIWITNDSRVVSPAVQKRYADGGKDDPERTIIRMWELRNP
jgi:Holliday junction resolvase RusA-like endonuclease